jgi:hypothetical protein
LDAFLLSQAEQPTTVLYKWYYEQQATDPAGSSLDLAFSDDILDVVEKQWRETVGDGEQVGEFMKFEDRNAMGEEDEVGEEY